MAGALIIGGVLLGLAPQRPLGMMFLVLPIGLAVAFVVMRRYAPSKAVVVGAVVAVGSTVLVVLPAIFVTMLSGDFASGPNCDGFCTTNTSGFVLALFLLVVSAIPVAIAAGIISAIASLVGVRTDSQPPT